MNRTVLITLRSLVTGFAAAALVPAAAFAQGAAADPQVTFTRDVAPIFQRSCVTCHRPGEIAPMSLMTYEDARPWARSIKARVATREMPPWHIDRHIGIQKFKDDPSLSDEEIATIVKWVDSGAPRGNLADMPPLRQFADASEWQIGKPDLVIRFPDAPRAGRRPRPVRFDVCGFAADRGPIHQGDPDAARWRTIAQGHPPRAVVLGGPRGQVPERW